MTKRLYYETDDLFIRATVLDIGQDEIGPWAIPDQTVAHVKGGGQKADRGIIGGVTLRDVVARDESALHYFEGAPPFSIGDVIEISVDPEWRRRQTVSHNSGHLIAAVVEENFPELKAVAAHHYEGEARVEFIGKPPTDLLVLRANLEAALTQAIGLDLPVQVIGDPYVNRAIQIGSYAAVPCGGTHPHSTGELGRIEIKSVKSKNGKVRVSYECG